MQLTRVLSWLGTTAAGQGSCSDRSPAGPDAGYGEVTYPLDARQPASDSVGGTGGLSFRPYTFIFISTPAGTSRLFNASTV